MNGGLHRVAVVSGALLLAAGCGAGAGRSLGTGARPAAASGPGATRLVSSGSPSTSSAGDGQRGGDPTGAASAVSGARTPIPPGGGTAASGMPAADGIPAGAVPPSGLAPRPAAQPDVHGPLRVLLVGDGVMYDAAPGMEAAFSSTGRAAVTDGSRWGVGLTQDGGWGWPAQWAGMVATLHPQVVVVHLGKWDAQPVVVGGVTLVPGTPEWAAYYRSQVDRALGILSAGGADVVWLGMAPEDVPGSEPATAAVNAVIRDATEVSPTAIFVDTLPLLGSPDGGYTQTVDDGGLTLTLRKPDGVHLCPDGAARLAAAAVAAVAAEPPLSTAPGWEAGQWRRDARYYWAPGGGCPSP